MADDIGLQAAGKKAAGKIKTPGKWFRKVPIEILLSPGGAILVIFALFMEIADLLISDALLPGASEIIEIIPELIFIPLFCLITKVPIQSALIPFIVERIPVLNDIVPTWIIKLFF